MSLVVAIRTPNLPQKMTAPGGHFSVSKSLAEFAARRRQRNKIIFSRDMCVRENTARAASVEFVRHRRTNYARSRPQAFCRKNPEGFSTVSSRPPGLLFAYTHYIIMYYSKTPLLQPGLPGAAKPPAAGSPVPLRCSPVQPGTNPPGTRRQHRPRPGPAAARFRSR